MTSSLPLRPLSSSILLSPSSSPFRTQNPSSFPSGIIYTLSHHHSQRRLIHFSCKSSFFSSSPSLSFSPSPSTSPRFPSLFPTLSSPLSLSSHPLRRFSSSPSSHPTHFPPLPNPLPLNIPPADFPGFSIKGRHLSGRGCYLDCAATTPLDPRVLDAMLPYLTEQFGNPHSRTHHFGWTTEAAVEHSRKHLADLIGADPKEIVFTSGATESNNLAIKGAAHFYKSKKKHLITTQTEHKCVLDSCRALEQEGFEVTYLPVQKDGIVDLEVLKASIRPDTGIISVMFVNNEIGVIQPITEIGKICRERGIFFHTDAAQAYGKIPIDVNRMNIDLLSISGHKIYGPKGIGALYIRRKPRVRLEPIISGGGQERGFRSGTLPAPLCVGIGEAARIAKEEMGHDAQHVEKLSKKLMDGLSSRLTHIQLNGSAIPQYRYPGTVNFSFSCVEGESLIMSLPDVAVSSGSACTSSSLEPSYVLRALQVDEEMAHTSIRFGLGRFTTEDEVEYAIESCVKNVGKLRDISALWDLVQDGVDLKSIQWTSDH